VLVQQVIERLKALGAVSVRKLTALRKRSVPAARAQVDGTGQAADDLANNLLSI
jgi:hypothetical protein